MSHISEIRKQTFDAMRSLLKEYPYMVAVPRPTGFGKTCMTTDLIRSGDYRHVLYVYPTEIIKNTVVNRYYSECEADTELLYKTMGEIRGVTLMTYKKLSMLEEDDPLLYNYDLIIFDECHRIGASYTLPKAQLLRDLNPTAHIIGLTATPNRSDGFDVVEEYFMGVTVFPYTLHDAFQDGLYKVPVYCYLHGDEDNLEERIMEDAFMAGEDIDNLRVTKVLKKKVVEIAKLSDISDNIRQTCTETFSDTSYMKFICFYSSHELLTLKSKRVVKWFKKAFPTHLIRQCEVSSRDSETQDVSKLTGFKRKENTIDLIHCCDMLNMGYHVGDISGIVMYRATGSDIIYPQQYGRVLDSGSSADHVIFDIADNLHRKLKIQQKRKPVDTGGHNGPVPVITGGDEKPIDLPPIDGGIVDPPGVDLIDVPPVVTGGTDVVPPENTTGTDVVPGDDDIDKKWYLGVSDLRTMDLRLASCTATYREQIAKLVAEPMQIRCKEAFEAHFRRWCIANGYKYPISNKELHQLYNTDKKEFVAYFETLIRENKLDYPMRDAEKLLEIGKSRPDGLPMDVFAKWKNVSIQSILELLEVA